jgi:hypothetical protein
LGLALAAGAQAQSVAAVGAQVGEPLGALSARGTAAGVEGVAELGFSFVDDFVDVAAFGITRGRLDGSPLDYYWGPGGSVRLEPDRLGVGILVAGGLMFETGRFEVFVQAAPTFQILPETAPRLRAAVGLRYLLR